jgi:superfamily II DNA or RNA helicase
MCIHVLPCEAREGGLVVTLRDYQTEYVTWARNVVARGKRRVLLVLPTGGGKTYVMAEIARKRSKKEVVCYA